MRIPVQSLASLSGLRIRRCLELWCKSQTQLRSGVAVAVVAASSCISDLTPSLPGNFHALGAALNRQKTKRKWGGGGGGEGKKEGRERERKRKKENKTKLKSGKRKGP